MIAGSALFLVPECGLQRFSQHHNHKPIVEFGRERGRRGEDPTGKRRSVYLELVDV